MPRVGFTIEEQKSSSLFRFEEGRGRIVDGCTVVGTGFNEGKCIVRLGIQRIGRDGKPTEDDVVHEELNFGKLAKFHPADAKNSEDPDPTDLGDAADGPEGNCILAMEGAYPDPKSKMSVFGTSLQNAGVRPALLNGFIPNLIDLEADFAQVKTKYDGLEKEGYCLIIKPGGNIHNLAEINKRAGGGTGAATGKTNAAPAKSNAPVPISKQTAPAPVAAASNGGDGGGETDMLAIQMFAALPGKKELVLTTAKVQSRLLTVMVQQKLTPVQMRDVQKVIGQPGWIGEQAEASGWDVSGENVTIPAA